MMKYILLLLSMITPHLLKAAEINRVITIGGAVTEIAYLLGAESTLVGSDTTSYFPPSAEKLSKVGYQRALSAEGILSLEADLIILNEEAGPPSVLAQLKSANQNILNLKAARSAEDIIENIILIGHALGKQKAAASLVENMQEQKEMLEAKVKEIETPPNVMIIHQHVGGAPMAAGKQTAANSIIGLSGGINVVDGYSGYKQLTPEAIISMNPDFIIIAAPRAESINDASKQTNHDMFKNTSAGQAGRIFIMDALELLGYGPRSFKAAIKLNKLYNSL